jgi:hypothetical protein
VSSHRGVPEVSCRKFLPTYFTRKILLGVTLGLLFFLMACGSSSPIPITGNFSNSSLTGTYVYHLSGADTTVNTSGNSTNEFYTEAGVFTADGAGNIKAGVDDFNSSVSGFSAATPITGTYSIGKDGNGSMTLNFGPGGQINLALTMVSTSQVYLTEADAFINFSANASGEADLQSSSAITAPPSGTFVFKAHQNFSDNSLVGQIGQIVSTNGAVTGNLDVLRSSQLTSLTFLANSRFGAPDSNGRGVLSYTDSAAITTTYEYYIVDTSHVWLMESDLNVLGTGFAEAQSASPTLAGNYAFGSSGDTASNVGGVRTIGAFTASSNSISAGAYDAVQDFGAAPTVNQPFTGTYTVAANGRASVQFTPPSGTAINEVFWLVNGSRAFFLVNDPNKVEDGTIDQQSTATFANSNLSGQYALVMDGQTAPFNYLTRVGTFIPNGSGALNLNEFVNAFIVGTLPGSINTPILPGTYAVSANGRTTSNITNLSANMVLYLVSPSQAYILQGDPGVEISGKVALQVSP